MADLYPKLQIVLDGNLETFITNVTFNHDPALNPVVTQAGYVGDVEGARMVTISGELAYPPGGTPFNPSEKMDARETVLVQLFLSDKTFESEGVITSASGTWSTDSPTSISFEMRCKWAPLK